MTRKIEGLSGLVKERQHRRECQGVLDRGVRHRGKGEKGQTGRVRRRRGRVRRMTGVPEPGGCTRRTLGTKGQRRLDP